MLSHASICTTPTCIDSTRAQFVNGLVRIGWSSEAFRLALPYRFFEGVDEDFSTIRTGPSSVGQDEGEIEVGVSAKAGATHETMKILR
jgi:hypothetical protein